MEGETKLSIYRAARSIKRKENTIYNALRSIYEDSIFVGEISQLWPELPLLANLRCGLWYFSKFHSTCYFKSTDGHTNNWSFNTSRLNLHVAHLAGEKGGCIIVDSTRKGKRFPDSMSKTIPIWTCVLNRAIRNHLSKVNDVSVLEGNSCSSNGHTQDAKQDSTGWDCSLHLPLWVSKTERASIEDRLEEWTKQLDASGADIATLAACLKKPLRPLWISQKTVIWLNEVPDHDSWDFTPIILVSASFSTGFAQIRTTSEYSWNYISGAGDDEESWARSLTPNLFWNHAYDLINAGPDLCNQKVADIVEKDRVYRAQRGQNAPQVIVKPTKLADSSAHPSHNESPFSLDITNTEDDLKSYDQDRAMSWLGATNLAIGTSQAGGNLSNVDCILNCDEKSISVSLLDPEAYLHLPTLTSKVDRFSLLKNLPSAVKFAKLNLSKGKKLLICCHNGEDISVCVCLAVLISLFDDGGTFDGGKFYSQSCITKWEMRKRLVLICKFAVNARPSRGNLKQVFSFLSGGRVNSNGKQHPSKSGGSTSDEDLR
ncbi:tRNA A64-2'-O-ribosylphosphate transferase [Trema orientale]|uniref:tRNA A64-2'-O-ribosylphosphate transferase n=1 Tax=Trema orientale TaxID=63057 RepID=A0A2P5FRU2_TREOI|nr:tRNA A64-2'-O-ribosylphosphate transferase [Trema orientale]